MTKTARTSRAAGGFTLLELILAVVVTAVVSAALFMCMSGAFRAQRQAEDQLAGRDAARAVMSLIRSDLTCVPPAGGRITGVFIGVDERGIHSGEADYVSFVTANPALESAQDVADLRRVELRLLQAADDPEHYVLVRLVTGNLLATVTPQPAVQVLARRVVSMSLRYFDGGDWVDEWDSGELENQIPQAVEVVLVTAPELRNEPANLEAREATYLTTTQIVRLPAAPESEGGILNLLGF